MRFRPMPDEARGLGFLQGGAGALIETLGRPGFSATLFELARKAVMTDHVTAFRSGGDERPRMILAENTGPGCVARDTADRYVDRYWRMDPVLAASPGESVRLFAIELAASDIEPTDYRTDCYTAVRLASRLSVCERRAGETMRLSFYRAQPFAEGEAEAVLEGAALLLPMLWRQAAEGIPIHRSADRSLFAHRLARRAPALSTREREICALIATGVGSEGIALELGISRNTVLTYRKRAYARLRISSQNELLRLVLD